MKACTGAKQTRNESRWFCFGMLSVTSLKRKWFIHQLWRNNLKVKLDILLGILLPSELSEGKTLRITEEYIAKRDD